MPLVFSLSDFNFSDIDGDTVALVRIDSLPVLGQLRLNGSDVFAGQTVSATQVNSGALVYTPAINGNGSPYATLSYSVSDGSLFSASQVLLVNILAVNNSPILVGNNLTLYAGSTVTLTPSNLAVVDADSLDRDLVFHIALARSGYFELTDSPGNRVTSFSQQRLRSGQVRFVHDGSDTAPSYEVAVSDGFATIGPSRAQISFYARLLLNLISVTGPNLDSNTASASEPRREIVESNSRTNIAANDAPSHEAGAQVSEQYLSGTDGETPNDRQDSGQPRTANGALAQRDQTTAEFPVSAVRPYIGGHWSNDVAVVSTTPLRLQFGPATNDSLTGCLNRRAFFADAERLFGGHAKRVSS